MSSTCKRLWPLFLAAALCSCSNTQPSVTPSASGASATPAETTSAPKPPPVDSAPPASNTTAAPTTAPSAAPVMDITAMCAEEIRRELSCKDDFVPMIVDTRIKLDLPKGTAARGKDKAGRDKLVAQAKKDFVVDYAPDKIETICSKRQAQVPSMPPEMLKELKALNEGCAAKPDCKGFTKCLAPTLEKLLSAGVSSGAH
jgi:hypothetical protein